ncbi:MAG: ATP-binding protein [Ghiorsea sp.]
MQLKNIRLRSAWYTLILLASIVPALVLAPWLSQKAHELLLENSLLKEELYHTELSINLELETKRLTSVLVNKADPMTHALSYDDQQHVHMLIDKIISREPIFNTISVYNPDMTLIAAKRVGHHLPKTITKNSPSFVVPLAGRVFLGSPSELDDHHFEFNIAVPIADKQEVIAVMIGTINIKTFWYTIKNAIPSHESKVYLIDGRGSLLTSSAESIHKQGDLLSSSKVVRSLLAEKDWHDTQAYIGFENTSVFGIGTLVDALQWGIISEVSERPIVAGIMPSLIALIVTIIFLHIFFALISLLFTGYLLNPISEFARVMKVATTGDYQHSDLHLSQFKEISTLSEAFNTMISQIDQRERTLTNMRYAMDHAGESILITNKDGVIEYVNATFCMMSGYTAEEAMGHNPSALIKSGSQDSKFYKQMWNTIRSGKTWAGELTDQKKDGTTYPISMTVSPIFSGEKITHFIAIQKDITDQRLLEDQLRQSQKMEAIGTLVGGIAHDFNNMLAGITGNLFLAKRIIYSGQDPEHATEKLIKAEELCQNAATMISHLLTFARKGMIDTQELTINDIVSQSLELVQHSIADTVTVTPVLTAEPLTVLCDSAQLQQIIINLLNNARDAVEDIKNPRIEFSLSRNIPKADFFQTHPSATYHPYALIKISDNGCGIENEDLEHIFDPFFTTKSVGKGTGLGLSMVYGAMQNLSGFIHVESTVGIGTTFYLYFPIISTTEKNEIDTLMHDENIAQNTIGQTITILLADDEDEVRQTTAEVLYSLDYHVLQACDGPQAVEAFQTHKDTIDLAILDVVMPHFAGVELAEKLRAINPNLPIIFVTGYDRHLVLGGEKMSNTEVLTKPVDFTTLENTIAMLKG